MKYQKRKHTLVVEMTLSQAVTDTDAVRALRVLLDRIDKEAKPVWANDRGVYAEKFIAKSFARVVRGRLTSPRLSA